VPNGFGERCPGRVGSPDRSQVVIKPAESLVAGGSGRAEGASVRPRRWGRFGVDSVLADSLAYGVFRGLSRGDTCTRSGVLVLPRFPVGPDPQEGAEKVLLMTEPDERPLGGMRATISREMVRLQAAYYGKGPTKAKTYIFDDLVVVVLEETFTRAEKTLVERGERDAIQEIRRRFQRHMADDFTAIVEQATGRKVRAFLSETEVDHDVSVETFLLADGRTDMSDFERASSASPPERG
jgi:uncharacterized protein YbcI